jgi:hypothetical protein
VVIAFVAVGPSEIEVADAVEQRQLEQLHVPVGTVCLHVVAQEAEMVRIRFKAEAAYAGIPGNRNRGQSDIGAMSTKVPPAWPRKNSSKNCATAGRHVFVCA